MSNTTSNRVITVLKTWFARHGIPVTVISENGPPFNSGDFELFNKELDFHHITSSPRHPQSNGRVENAMKSCVVTGSELCYLLCYVHELIAKRVIVTIGYSS